MQKLKNILLLVALALGILLQHMAQAQNQLRAAVAGSGAANSANNNNRVVGTLGQATIGTTGNSSTMIKGGFWHVPRQILFNPPPSSWNFTANTGGNATIAAPFAINPTIGGQPLQTGDGVGVFFLRDGSLVCAGFSIWDVGRNMSITAWADDPQTTVKDGFASSEEIRYKIWDESDKREYDAVATYRSGGSNFAINGIYELSSLTAVLTTTHSLVLAQGWNMISSFVQPATPALENLLSGILSSMVLLKNGDGQVFWPALNINTIGPWDFRDGYQIFMQSAATLSIVGTEVSPQATPIALNQGWNLAPYLRNSPQDIQVALASIANRLVIVKNNAGQVYWPQFNINTIGSMLPGQGYQINVSQAATLTYPVNSAPAIVATRPSSKALFDASPQHYPSVPNSGVNATLLVECSELADGDELAITTSRGLRVGSAMIRQGKALLTVWGDNRITAEVIEGAPENEALTLKVWSQATQTEKPLAITSLREAVTDEPLANNLRFKIDALWLATVALTADVPQTFSLQQNYPNPFNPSTLIKYGLAHDVKVKLEVYNLLGQRVAMLLDEPQKAGYHEIVFQGQALPSGVYFYRLQAGSFVQTRRMTLVR